MPRIFSAEERELLRRKIMKAAREQFWKKGFTKTSIADVAGAAGIAAGTFYNFFESKEMLFFRILEEFSEVKQREFEICFTGDGDPMRELQTFLENCAAYLLADPFFQIFYSERVHERIRAKVPVQEQMKHLESDRILFEKIVLSCQKRGYLTSITAEDLLELVQSIILSIAFSNEMQIRDIHDYAVRAAAVTVHGLRSLEQNRESADE